MAAIAPIIGILGTAVSFMGSIAQSNALNAQAQATQQQAAYQAQVLRQQGQEQLAASQRKSLDDKRQAQYVQGRLQAQAAAGGGGADDPTIIKLSSDIAAQGEYNALADLYSGQSAKVAAINQGNLAIYQGDINAMALRSRADATLLGGIGGLFGSLAKFG